MKYNIKIFNGSDCLVYDELIEAKDENAAIVKVLDEVIICTDDKIIIE